MIFLCSDQWITVLLCWCVGLLLGLLMRKGFGMNGFEWPSYENKDQLYNDSPGTFLGELLNVIESRHEKVAFVAELTDINMNEKYLIWQFRSNCENWGFGFAWIITNVRERVKMKHAVKLVAYVETEETDLKRVAELGIEKLLEQLKSDFMVVDVHFNNVGFNPLDRETVCVNITELVKVSVSNAPKQN